MYFRASTRLALAYSNSLSSPAGADKAHAFFSVSPRNNSAHMLWLQQKVKCKSGGSWKLQFRSRRNPNQIITPAGSICSICPGSIQVNQEPSLPRLPSYKRSRALYHIQFSKYYPCTTIQQVNIIKQLSFTYYHQLAQITYSLVKNKERIYMNRADTQSCRNQVYYGQHCMSDNYNTYCAIPKTQTSLIILLQNTHRRSGHSRPPPRSIAWSQ